MAEWLSRAWDRYLLTEDAALAEPWQLEELGSVNFPREPHPDVYRRLRAGLATFGAPEPGVDATDAPLTTTAP